VARSWEYENYRRILLKESNFLKSLKAVSFFKIDCDPYSDQAAAPSWLRTKLQFYYRPQKVWKFENGNKTHQGADTRKVLQTKLIGEYYLLDRDAVQPYISGRLEEGHNQAARQVNEKWENIGWMDVRIEGQSGATGVPKADCIIWRTSRQAPEIIRKKNRSPYPYVSPFLLLTLLAHSSLPCVYTLVL
jgi:hypothetical protein